MRFLFDLMKSKNVRRFYLASHVLVLGLFFLAIRPQVATSFDEHFRTDVSKFVAISGVLQNTSLSRNLKFDDAERLAAALLAPVLNPPRSDRARPLNHICAYNCFHDSVVGLLPTRSPPIPLI